MKKRRPRLSWYLLLSNAGPHALVADFLLLLGRAVVYLLGTGHVHLTGVSRHLLPALSFEGRRIFFAGQWRSAQLLVSGIGSGR